MGKPEKQVKAQGTNTMLSLLALNGIRFKRIFFGTKANAKRLVQLELNFNEEESNELKEAIENILLKRGHLYKCHLKKEICYKLTLPTYYSLKAYTRVKFSLKYNNQWNELKFGKFGYVILDDSILNDINKWENTPSERMTIEMLDDLKG